MPIAYDSASLDFRTDTTLTASHTIGSGTNRILFAGVVSSNNISATFGGVSMSVLTTLGAQGNNRALRLFYLKNPAISTNNVVATGGEMLGLFCTSYRGVDLTGFPDHQTTNTSASASSLTTNNTTVKPNCWLINFTYAYSLTLSAGTGATSRANSSSNDSGAMFDSGGAKATPGTNGMTISGSGTNSFSTIQLSIAPFIGGIIFGEI